MIEFILWNDDYLIEEKLPKQMRLCCLRSGSDAERKLFCSYIIVTLLCKQRLLLGDIDKDSVQLEADPLGKDLLLFYGTVIPYQNAILILL